MDYENYNHQGTPPNNYGTPPNNYGQNPPPGNYGPGPESNSFSTAAMILGIVSLVSSCCLYISIPVGAVGIILALLSKGSSSKMDSRSKTGLGISIAGICISFVMIIAVLVSDTYLGSTQKLYQDYLEYYLEMMVLPVVLPADSPNSQTRIHKTWKTILINILTVEAETATTICQRSEIIPNLTSRSRMMLFKHPGLMVSFDISK
ncbi:hypothetical protein [uncultured Robinsoniella sp.]|uniref:hypothetical protein n=1 Tax=uncultured Robinsoniella sp. TaxID=904190 RepID=UPI00374E70F4